jgi:hypothetical protein
MVAMVFQGANVVDPLWGWVALAFVGGAYLLTKLPRRITVAASVATIAAAVGNPVSTQVIFNGIDCCDLWYFLYFICWPTTWGC